MFYLLLFSVGLAAIAGVVDGIKTQNQLIAEAHFQRGRLISVSQEIEKIKKERGLL